MLTNIVAEMARRQMSKKEMAKKLDMNELTFAKKLKNEESYFSIKQLVKIQVILNESNPAEPLTIDYLIAE